MIWQKIDTAPKDGTFVVVREGDLIVTANYTASINQWVTPTDGGRLCIVTPTLWASLDSIKNA